MRRKRTVLTGFPETHQTFVNLIGLQPQLPPVVLRALELTNIDFTIIQGLRTVAQQKADVAAGKSKTMQSRHLTGHAVDFCALVNGQADWTPAYYYQIVLAFKQASDELNTPLVWGGIWDRGICDLSDNPEADVQAYHQREHALGVHNPLTDLDHVELDRKFYP